MFRRRAAWLALLLVLTAGGAGAEPVPEALFLVAAPGVVDAANDGEVVLIRRHAAGNTIGVTLNRPLGASLRDLYPDSRPLQPEEQRLYDGGDTGQDELVYLFQTGSLTPRNALQMFGPVYLGRDRATLAGILQHPRSFGAVRVYRGFRFWPGQSLQREILRGDWWLVEADLETLFGTPADALWRELVGRVGPGAAERGPGPGAPKAPLSAL